MRAVAAGLPPAVSGLCGGGLGAAAVPAIVPATVFGRPRRATASSVGFIGCGNQSTIDLPAFLGQDDAQVLAVCDVNTASDGYKTPEQFLGRKPAQEKVNAYYAAKTPRRTVQGLRRLQRFPRGAGPRATSTPWPIVVPDHWHALMTVLAAQAGKDIYCEKPLSLSVRQGQAMVEAVREHKRVLQTGSHYRSSPAAGCACELVRNGRIGKLQRIIARVAEQNAVDPGPGLAAHARARGLRLRDLARPRAAGALSQGPLLLPLPLQPGLFRRADDELRRPLERPGPVGPGHGPHRAGGVRGHGLGVAAPGRAVQHGHQGRVSAPATPTASSWSADTASAGFRHPLRGHGRLGRVRLRRRDQPARIAQDLARSAPTKSTCR